MRRAVASLAVLLGTLTMVAGCGDDGSSGSSDGAKDPKVIQVTIKGDSVTPNGERVDVAVGQEVRLDVTADKAGEIHVHSDPEQELEYKAGESTVSIKPIDVPGTIDVESHQLEKVIVQLEVR